MRLWKSQGTPFPVLIIPEQFTILMYGSAAKVLALHRLREFDGQRVYVDAAVQKGVGLQKRQSGLAGTFFKNLTYPHFVNMATTSRPSPPMDQREHDIG